MIGSTIRINYEQAVYGTFSFWNRGYGLLARSEGCRPEWLAALKSACQRYGEPPAGVSDTDALFVLSIDDGPWMIVGVSPQGADDAGRPGAQAFHALFIGRWSYWRAGADPFVFAPLLRRDWSPEDQDAALPGGQAVLRRGQPGTAGLCTDSDLPETRATIVDALSRGRRVAVHSPNPIDRLAREVWRALPFRVRLRTSLATRAFDDGNRFDLVALPRLARVTRSAYDLILTDSSRESCDA